jgi:prepilin-type N-terminal cleavage/methylation domain-containing protein
MLNQQSGRSMIEMLGVLAIIGVLSVGALEGYQMAITNHKANKAVGEIQEIIDKVREAYENEKDYSSLDDAVAINIGLRPDDGKNVLDRNLYVRNRTGYAYPAFQIIYYIKSETICEKILLSQWINDLGREGLIRIAVYHNTDPTVGFEWAGWDTYYLPPTVADVASAQI